jgi:hypothetical protein
MDDCHLSYITKLKKKKEKRNKTLCVFLLALLVVKANWSNNSFSVCR